MGPDDDLPLGKSSVQVTRPGEKGLELVQALKALGATTYAADVLQIDLLGEAPAMQAVLGEINPSSILVFVSVPAVNALAEALSYSDKKLPYGIRVAAVGAATADALNALDIKVAFTPDTEMNSEGLLALFEDVVLLDRHIILFRGQSGRELLGRTFRQRGARVVEIESYRRRYLHPDLSSALAEFTPDKQRSIIITSVELLNALIDCLDDAQKVVVFSSDLVALSQRIADAARVAGFRGRVAVAPDTDNAGLVKASLLLAGSA